MTTLSWHTPGANGFEAGVDRGVLYPSEGDTAVPWNGLVRVTDSSTGGAATPYYFDGVKYLNMATPEEFAGTIEAFTYPDEFMQFDGSLELDNGLILTAQKRKSFGLSYRTKVGNELDVDEGYKIHLLYNVLASPSNKSHDTVNASASPMNFSWAITTTPVLISGKRPTAHVILDSRNMTSELLAYIEGLLYGTPTAPPSLPPISDLQELVTDYVPFQAFLIGIPPDYVGYVAGGNPSVQLIGAGGFDMNHPTVVDNGDGTFTVPEQVA